MANYISLNFRCTKCDCRWNELVDRKDKEAGIWPECMKCGTADAVINEIATPRVFKAAYHDGVKRPGFQEAKEQLDVEISKLDF
jgi:predicted nucleic-acid-binding Zn-ribbon protein